MKTLNSEELGNAFGPQVHIEIEGRDELAERIRNLEARISAEEKKYEWDELGDRIHETNVDKGFWSEPVMMDKYAAKMMLVVTETAEVVEALRKSQGKDKVTEEFADIFIRALDLYKVLVDAGEADPKLYAVLLDKMETNRNRPAKHGNRWG